jgi:proline dehydrogenase
VLGPSLLMASRSTRLRRLVTNAPVSRRLVDRFVAGATAEDALATTSTLADAGLTVTIDRLGEDTLGVEQAEATRDAYVMLLGRLGDCGLAKQAEVSLKLSAIGQALPSDGHRIALDNVRAVCEAAQQAGTTVTLDMEDHTTVDSTLDVLMQARADFPWLGAVLQSCLRRTEQDSRDLAYEGSRVRLVKGAYAEPTAVAYSSKADVDRAYARCLRILMEGPGHPMVATHDARMIALTEHLAVRHGRASDTYEYQMLYGICAGEQQRLVDAGAQVRVYVPYGADWYGYFMRRLAERPANVAFFVRSVLSH